MAAPMTATDEIVSYSRCRKAAFMFRVRCRSRISRSMEKRLPARPMKATGTMTLQVDGHRVEIALHRLVHDVDADGEERQGVHQGHGHFEALEAEGEFLVGPFLRYLFAGVAHDQGEHVGEVVPRVGYQGQAARQEPADVFGDGDHRVEKYHQEQPAPGPGMMVVVAMAIIMVTGMVVFVSAFFHFFQPVIH